MQNKGKARPSTANGMMYASVIITNFDKKYPIFAGLSRFHLTAYMMCPGLLLIWWPGSCPNKDKKAWIRNSECFMAITGILSKYEVSFSWMLNLKLD